MKKINKKNLPNLLTIIRIFIVAPILIIMFLYWLLYNIGLFKPYGNIDIAFMSLILAFFVLAMILDLLDGLFARIFKSISNFGKLWDPLADKIVTTSVLIFLAATNIVPFWLVAILVFRDIIVDGVRVVMYKNNISIAANIFGKLKTLVLTLAIIFILLIYISLPSYFEKFGYVVIFNIPMIVATILSIFSGYIYLKKAKSVIF
ncbi:CDP-diacylglycerol--glycerol-3-phosphate 3-phosphatidyltransferase [Mycoplasmopsis cynos]|nr:CDP-diacylglycerol--glycerol-3-phosphate 3-phosphatidyltransferase [Mycoplasmopsis cynos]MCU9935506.1 CDP-diacylglycerol--glycerol-3-phosphate 3-phosphatidyltransferase [Mycoplasmopsis cynos]UWV80286.1 CDP-diacylglycerol--glycerol-3-phosphate 3-phosphatidyltransferase [Mycoplasmopsis cynos]UWV85779.1 CDP-diacylglycerol--glycerol-3-phosphate 3-phosphatidyltransferase [Mycoplasmopsis cynos]WAM05766.1 CDP-diacylglycerol--glycerol-3-phosphate 3-phosphatidyltransferase [Mycoplasmopsis cynos]WAM0